MQKKPYLSFGLNLPACSISGCTTLRDRMSIYALGPEVLWRDEIKVMAAEWWMPARVCSCCGVPTASSVNTEHQCWTGSAPRERHKILLLPLELGRNKIKLQHPACSQSSNTYSRVKTGLTNWYMKCWFFFFFTEFSSITFLLLSTPYFYLYQPFSNNPVLKVSGYWLMIFSEEDSD